MKKENLLSTNFLIALSILIGSYFSISENVAQQAIGWVVAGMGVFGLVRTAVKGAIPRNVREFLKDPNTWTHLAAVVTAGIPVASVLVDPVHEVANAILAGSMPKIITTLISLGTIIFYTFVKKPTT